MMSVFTVSYKGVCSLWRLGGLNELNESLLDTITNLSCSVLFSEKSWLYGDEPYWIIKNR